MFFRALIAFIALPGVIAILVPVAWLWSTSHTTVVQPLGLLPLAVGFAALLWCVQSSTRAECLVGYGERRATNHVSQETPSK